MDYYIYKVKIWKTGLLDAFDHYVITKDALAVYEFYDKKGLSNSIDNIERIGRMDKLPAEFMEGEGGYYLYETYYTDPGNTLGEVFKYAVSEDIKTIHQKLKININWIRLVKKIDVVFYVRSFQDVEDEIEQMRIG